MVHVFKKNICSSVFVEIKGKILLVCIIWPHIHTGARVKGSIGNLAFSVIQLNASKAKASILPGE